MRMDLKQMSELLGYTLEHENQEIKNLVYDSRQVTKGSVFFAIKGQDSDGHQYIEDAVRNGAIAVVGEESLNPACLYFEVFNTKKALAIISSKFYGEPSKNMNLVGVIGTNGKTTITYLIQHVFECLGIDSGLIGTNGSWVGQKKKASRTTPLSPDLNELLQEGVRHNLPYVVMEVSSHGIKENRVDQLDFDRLIFTNITEEHLDYHKTF
ncbi:UDP-N-acetylmuramoyl-L-alanyl-D-glutamate--2,6-diaminopimelate ligase, partial [Turicibacter sanguinis]|nr:UDP-N-acetylmuramoyl-L-alanyl-D-glutamate--2,6-diaminopimelate ligase [Turicibacter sanguinis]MTM61935.1 UDP-N-acetylmuramoyl-L-alanyl-D-glutamate--2,6-diaminopimelate ligase [Turicibacter sanguinis]